MKTNGNSQKLLITLAGALILSVALSPLGNLAYAVNLADTPLEALNPVKPNIMYILDNSGSMVWHTVTGFDGNGEYDSGRTTSAYYSSDYNHVYYNPAITYRPPVSYIGNPLFTAAPTTQTSPAGFVGSSLPSNAPVDPFPGSPSGTATTDLTQTCYISASSPLAASLPIGTSNSSGNCRNPSTSKYKTLVARYAFYYVWNGTTNINMDLTGQSAANTAFTTRVDIIPANAPFGGSVRAGRSDCAAAPSCTYAEEIANFANSYSYYSTRIKMAKSSIGRAFFNIDPNPTLNASVNPKFRVGFTTINSGNGGSTYNNPDVTDTPYWLTIRDYSSTSPSPAASQKAAWYNDLYAINPGNGTPLRNQLNKIGRMYQKTLSGAADPVQYSCQPNYAILQTDGYWNAGETPPAGIGDQDSNPADGYSTRASGSIDGNAQSDTLADVAMYYYKNDLRTSALGNCTGALGAGTDVCTNNVSTSAYDNNKQQHMVTFTIGLGANGQNPYDPNYQTATTGFFPNLKAGTANWPIAVGDTATAIDDLWHAAVNGRGSYLNAADPQTLTNGLSSILNNIVARQGSAAGASVSSPNIAAGNNTAFSVGYDSLDWSGNVKAFTVNPTTGATSITPLWQANAQIDVQAAGSGWDTNRIIATKNSAGAGGVPFRLANIGTPTALGLTTTAQQKVLNYLRGDKSNEGVSIGQYRVRNHVLGDIVDSEAVVVGAPVAPYIDQNNKGYGQFKGNNTSRASTIYLGANDGMLHAIDAATGNEKWAYVPGILLDSSHAYPAVTSLAALTYQVGAYTPAFSHNYYVDATPVVADVDFATTGGSTCSTTICDWHTILVGGLNKGGKGFYALDITDPNAASESAAAAKVLWEFTDGGSTDMGYSFGKPLISKTKLYGWVVIISSGYNNTSGRSIVYVLNAKTGAKLFQFNVPAGTNNGLAHLAGYTLDISDYTVQQVYGGDLDGNVWRFDVNPSLTLWSPTPTLFAQLRDVNGNVQPVTTQPEIESDPKNNTDRWIFVGTGKLLDTTDLTTATNYNDSMYAVKDGFKTQVEPAAHPGFSLPVTRAQLVLQSPTSTTGITLPAVSSGKDGWVIDFATGSGERVNVDPIALGGAVAWVTNTPTNDPCTQGLKGAAYVRDYETANTLIQDATGVAMAAYQSPNTGFVKIQAVKINGTVRIIATTDDSIKNNGTGGTALGGTSALGTTVCSGNCNPSLGKAIRTNWREILQ